MPTSQRQTARQHTEVGNNGWPEKCHRLCILRYSEMVQILILRMRPYCYPIVISDLSYYFQGLLPRTVISHFCFGSLSPTLVIRRNTRFQLEKGGFSIPPSSTGNRECNTRYREHSWFTGNKLWGSKLYINCFTAVLRSISPWSTMAARPPFVFNSMWACPSFQLPFHRLGHRLKVPLDCHFLCKTIPSHLRV